MSQVLTPDALPLRWLRWWRIDSWLQAESGWRDAAFYRLDATQLTRLARSHHAQLSAQLQLPAQVATADGDLLQLAQLPLAQRLHALRLAAEVCWRDCSGTGLSAEQQRWCRSIAQGMRPGLWLAPCASLSAQPAVVSGLWLLRLRAGTLSWSRLRLAFSPDDIRQAEQVAQPDAFPARLLPLWQAVIWYAAQEPSC